MGAVAWACLYMEDLLQRAVFTPQDYATLFDALTTGMLKKEEEDNKKKKTAEQRLKEDEAGPSSCSMNWSHIPTTFPGQNSKISPHIPVLSLLFPDAIVFLFKTASIKSESFSSIFRILEGRRSKNGPNPRRNAQDAKKSVLFFIFVHFFNIQVFLTITNNFSVFRSQMNKIDLQNKAITGNILRKIVKKVGY